MLDFNVLDSIWRGKTIHLNLSPENMQLHLLQKTAGHEVARNSFKRIMEKWV